MAVVALVAELALMDLVFQVAGTTLRTWRRLEDRFNVAITASNGLVRSVQCEIRQSVVIKKCLCPRPARMAGLALSAIVALVLIVLEVASATFRLHVVDIVERVLAVTVATAQLRVSTLEWKIGVAGVVEARVRPRAGVVTVVALIAAATFVRVVFGMTADTGRRRILMRRVFVAVRALRLTMCADQREVCCVVVKFRVGPVSRIVTVGAFGTEIAFVNIIIGVAAGAITGRIAMFVGGVVAVRAYNIDVFAQ